MGKSLNSSKNRHPSVNLSQLFERFKDYKSNTSILAKILKVLLVIHLYVFKNQTKFSLVSVCLSRLETTHGDTLLKIFE